MVSKFPKFIENLLNMRRLYRCLFYMYILQVMSRHALYDFLVILDLPVLILNGCRISLEQY